MQLRPASIADLEVLQWWHQQAHVVDAGSDAHYNWQKELQRKPQWREQLMAEEDGQPIGFLQIYDPYDDEAQRWGNVSRRLRAIDIWIGEAENLNKGYGTQMMQLAMALCFANPDVHALLVDPIANNIKAQRFYARLGFKFVESKKIQGESCYVLKIRRDQYEKAIA
ncbi:GNAT family N-acetyltransferase [Planctobacterium marinum]|uniref:GNAT family N-acetyltransferase n=1 Tax=Planctobacterium marinum TaxID=1631968 RepID=UPI001E3A2EAE|nr:GNAT family N-acetyltransferase [Planctobacterium marinum]MCC2605554.1 acetyltransferase [Planctobacterium marinum]